MIGALPFVGVRDAAFLTGWHPDAIRRACETGEIRASRSGGFWYIHRAHLEAWAGERP